MEDRVVSAELRDLARALGLAEMLPPSRDDYGAEEEFQKARAEHYARRMRLAQSAADDWALREAEARHNSIRDRRAFYITSAIVAAMSILAIVGWIRLWLASGGCR